MGFAFLASTYESDEYYRRRFTSSKCCRKPDVHGYKDYGWGYPFDWETRNGPMFANTPLITTLPYAYEAFFASLCTR